MGTVGAYEAKTHLSALLERVSKGEEITITKNGRPVARMVPATPRRDPQLRTVIDEILEMRERHPLGDMTIRQLIEEGRRY